MKAYPNYDQTKKMLQEVPLAIAEIRKNKDVSDDVNELVKEVNDYRKILDELLNAYNEISGLF